MDNSNLIDFNKEECEGGKKLISPLIPNPPVIDRRLSDVENNPFDIILRTVTNRNDPFECVSDNTSINYNKNFKFDELDNKENVGYLVSPIQTPSKSRNYKKITNSPLFLKDKFTQDTFNNHLTLPIVSKLQNSSMECNISDVSLQILSDSMLNVSDVNLADSFQLALNLPLPSDSSDDNINSSETKQLNFNIPSVIINSDFNNAFIDHSNKLSTKSSVSNMNTPTSFNTASLGRSEISNIYPSTSSTNSKDMPSDANPLNEAFMVASNTGNTARKCMSARKAKDIFYSYSNAFKSKNLNNSFGGFNSKNDEILNPYKFCSHYDNDSIFLEGSHLAESFRAVAPIEFEDEAISTCTPPWLEENINFVDEIDENPETKQINSEVATHNVELVEETRNNNDAAKEELNRSNNEKDDSDVQNAKDLLHNLSKILNKSGDVVDQRALGENLLNSLALALNIDNRNVRSEGLAESKSFKMQRSKSDSKVNEKTRLSTNHLQKKMVPKMRIQPIAPVKLDKNMLHKTEKEKTTNKGPLKALISFANVPQLKNSKIKGPFGLFKSPALNVKLTLFSIDSTNRNVTYMRVPIAKKTMNTVLTPPKNSQISLQYQIKKTSTPNESKLKSPIAQSTPDLSYKKSPSDANKITPVSKRQFGFSLSPLARPASTHDISNISLHKSISPTQNSGSSPNVNTSLNKSGNSAKYSSIPTITRRNSVTEMNSSRNTFNRSFENNTAARSSQLKRSSSFQSKTNSTNTAAATTAVAAPRNNIKNNNTVKKYGLPGKIKPLKLVPKTNKNTAV